MSRAVALASQSIAVVAVALRDSNMTGSRLVDVAAAVDGVASSQAVVVSDRSDWMVDVHLLGASRRVPSRGCRCVMPISQDGPMRRMRWMSVLFASAAVLLVEQRDARACGGCFTPPPPPMESESVITDEKMILAISMTQTTLYDQISYSGSPSSFAWVLPIKGTVTVGLSADVLFQVINQATTTEVEEPASNCPPAPQCTFDGETDDSGTSDDDTGSGGGEGVTVTSQAQVGPYETVQLHSTDGSALNDWLTAHGYQIPASTQVVIDAYVTQGFDFLALKLVPGAGVQAMQPVRVTSQGAAPTLPLHMVAVGTGPTTGITIWVVADGRWEPSNFPTFTIADSEIAWDWATNASNYETLRLAKEATFGGRGWQIEISLELAQYTIQQSLVQSLEYDATGGYLTAASSADGGVGGDAGASDGGFTDDAGADGGVDVGGGADTSAANTDLAVLFTGLQQPNVRITRMRSDVAQSALSVDMILGASADQAELTNIHYPQLQIGEPQCPVYDDQCAETGTVPRSQAASGTATTGTGGCSTTPPRTFRETTLALVLGLGGLLALGRTRRRRAAR